MALSPSANVKAVSSYKGIFTNIREFIKIFQTFRPCKAAWAILEQFHQQVGAARKAYRQFLQEGLGTGHQAHYYEAVDQRFLGDERFLAEIQQKTEAKHEVMVKEGTEDKVCPRPSGGGYRDGPFARPFGSHRAAA